MRTIVWYECKKILNRKSAGITLLLMIVCILALCILFIAENSYHNAAGSHLTGMAAIHAKKAVQTRFQGELRIPVLREALSQYQTVINNPASYSSKEGMTADLRDDVYIRDILPYEEILSLLRRVYSPAGVYDYYILSAVTPKMINDFYATRHARIKEIVNMNYSYGNFSEPEKAFILRKDAKVKVPFQYDYTDGWSDLLTRGFLTVFLLTGLAVCVMVAPLFSCEYQTGMDSLVLSSRNGRGKVIRAKITAGFLTATCLFLVAAALFTGVMLAIYGVNGWNASFQVLSYSSFYNLTVGQVFGCGVLINYLIILAVTAVTMLLSAVCRTSFASVIISTLGVLLPLFIPGSKTSGLLNHLLNLFPAKAMDSFVLFSGYDVYSWGKIVVSWPIAVVALSALILCIALPGAYHSFRRHQVI